MDSFQNFQIIPHNDAKKSFLVSELKALWYENLQKVREGELILIESQRSISLIAVISLCLSRRIPFMFKSQLGNEEYIRPKWILKSDELILYNKNEECQNEICYVITTSGSTGSPKTVAVSRGCIYANIQDFIERFEIKSSDMIAFTTSLFFDPSIVELFLPIFTGAKLLFFDDESRASPDSVASAIREHCPSVLQLTPSFMYLLSDDILRFILGPDSPLKILLIGGEKFPLELVKRFRSSRCSTRVFDCYGVTEMSCWATVFEVKMECEEIVVGSFIKNTSYRITEENELVLNGTRSCFIDGKESNEVYTGDLIEKCSVGIRIVGRKDDLIKFNGIRFHADSLIAKILKSFVFVRNGKLIVFKEKYLILFLVSTEELKLKDVTPFFPPLLLPTRLIHLDCFPTTRNGKIDVKRLINSISDPQRFTKDLKQFLKERNMRSSDIYSHSFVKLGITSVDAAELSLILRNPEVLQDVLSSTLPIYSFLRKYNVELLNDMEFSIVPSTVRGTQNNFLKLILAYNLKKCIDSTPVALKLKETNCIIACSHAGIVVCISVQSLQVLWETKLKTRIEGSPVVINNCLVCIGGFDGHLYFIDAFKGEVVWTFETSDQIKGTPITNALAEVFVISYDSFLYKLNYKKKEMVWKTKLTSGSSSPPMLVLNETHVLCTTIKGTVELIDTEEGKVQYVYIGKAPVFSPAVVTEENEVIITSVDGTITKLDIKKGVKITDANVQEPIFSSSFITGRFVVVATQKGGVFIFNTELTFISSLKLLDSSFVKSAFEFSSTHLGLMSTNGRLYTLPKTILEMSSGQLRNITFDYCQLAAGQIFSHPCLTSDNSACLLVVGSRDDWLRCWRK